MNDIEKTRSGWAIVLDGLCCTVALIAAFVTIVVIWLGKPLPVGLALFASGSVLFVAALFLVSFASDHGETLRRWLSGEEEAKGE